MQKLRDYQIDAIDSAFALSANKGGILVLPTGSGKSHVIAGIVNSISGKSIVLQPTKEILESNLEKVLLSGLEDVGIYSASMGIKKMDRVTYATIGTIIKIADQIKDCEAIIIDEAHLVNAKGGQYLEFIEKVNPEILIGLTATPYRLHSNSFGSQMKMLTRTRPKIFKFINHVTECQELVKRGYLHKPEFMVSGKADRQLLLPNTTGAEFSDSSIRRYYQQTDIRNRILDAVDDALEEGSRHPLVFMSSVDETMKLVDVLRFRGISADYVSAKSSKFDREENLRLYRTGQIRVMVNVGILLLGYDFPELDCIICARPTMSLALWYQLIGRGIRSHPDKKRVLIYDLVDNFSKFGNPLDWRIIEGSTGLYYVISESGRLTGRTIEDGPEVDEPLDFGKYWDEKLKNIPLDYMEWFCASQKKSPTWHKFDVEIKRREIWR